MKAVLIAHTRVDVFALDRAGFFYEVGASDVDTLAEFAGRACYQSFHRPNPATARNRDYLAHIIDVGHFSVLEHGSASFYITGVSRSLTHELVRHRHFSFSQLSQRYVDESDAETVIPPAYQAVGFENLAAVVRNMHDNAKSAYEGLANAGTGLGLSRKESRQAARSVLPNANETRIVVTGNMRAWREFLAKRWHEAADEEIKHLAGLILDELRNVAPGSVQDVPSSPYEYPERSITREEAAAAMSTRGLTDGVIVEALDAMFGPAA